MRITISQMKGGPTHLSKERPSAFSARGRLYDYLLERRGLAVPVWEIIKAISLQKKNDGRTLSALGQMAALLNIDYDLDIRSTTQGYWCLCGKWDGVKYTDYVAAHHTTKHK